MKEESYDADKFRSYLTTNTNMAESSILLYCRAMSNFFKEHKALTVEAINDYVSKHFRESKSSYVKYAIKRYLEMIGQESLYAKIVKVRQKPRDKHGTYLPDHILRKVINNMENQMYSDIAMLQYLTGARAREIITLRAEKIDYTEDSGQKVIRLWLEAKGGKERPAFLRIDYNSLLSKYMDGKPGFLFLPERCMYEDPFDIERTVSNIRTYVYNSLRASARSLGISNIGTHDLRRNASESMRRKGARIEDVKDVLGHSNISTTSRYFDHNPDNIRRSILSHQGDDPDD